MVDMKICILGATGKSGRRLTRAALERGHDVTAVVRDAAKAADLAHNRLTVRTPSYSDEAELAEALRGHDAVINAAGYISDGPDYVPLVHRIIRATETALGPGGRFWLFGGAALLDVPGTSITTLDLPGVPKIFEAHRANFTAVRETQLDWSMLCPGPMTESPDGKATDGLVLSENVWPVPRPALTQILPSPALSLAFVQAMPRMTIYYEDAARVVLDHLAKNDTLSRKRVGVALPSGQEREKDVALIR
jgi:putative NADH-flavin reductase